MGKVVPKGAAFSVKRGVVNMDWMTGVDRVSKWTAAVGVWMTPALALTVFYDVVMRYLFRAPTFWAYETSWMLYSGGFLLGLGYALREGSHVRVDLIITRFSPKRRLTMEMLFLLLMLIFSIVITWHGTIYAIDSWKLLEGSHLTIWAPPVYPVKTLIPVCFFVLSLQTIVEFMRKLQAFQKVKREASS